MLTFFRKIRKSLLNQDASSKYLIYALGEIVLVVLGILIALQINNWNEHRKQKRVERDTLIEIKEDIEATLFDIDLDVDLHSISMNAILSISNFISGNEPWHDSLAMDFEFAYYDFRISSIETAYRALVVKGVELLSNKDIRNDVSMFYDVDIPWLRRVETENGKFHDILFDYYRKHFTINEDPELVLQKDIDMSKKTRDIVPRGFIPLNKAELKSDPEFKVLVREVIYERAQILDYYKQIEEKVTERLIPAMEEEIKNL